ncbi:LacI family DNA-binding transcriptional regulator [Marinomonas mediterranea]|uniref:Transcriptional regulator, LacI family n=1 Tax=Marinomonas mediterranea (strain ATCC 700492 / JCM 21426 / NBRC 103028 / MMB-1) TaxID=717774 RepID=F2JXM6_MARM1|nr:LacI family DNA-binding transcriptional regulator [Marinomonas mediterranea]ADZ93024.1 transcriptional regulator, LacI family [Marinomonas mediterranea MMB-1]WCN10934.1 substrate-binding domain-containing protein [Marinomonas mediterranea]WCN19040.1 substrate-binding domain-containing protein [Marinomonas mediterranea MMB-1]
MISNKNNNISSRSMGRVTLADVAEKAGVSPITASRALKNPQQVSEKLRTKIYDAVNELGYIPNHAARSLASSETKIISVIFPSLSNAVFPDVLDGIHDTLAPAGYRILLANTHYETDQEEILVRTLLEQNPDGIIVTGIDQNENTRKLLLGSKTPVVQIMELTDFPIDMNVGFSHFQASYDLVRHLQNAGYKKIGFIGARMDPRSQRRMEGYKHAMQEIGISNNDYVLTNQSHTSFKLGAKLFNQLFTQFSDLEAICFSNDDLAAGAMFECSRKGIRVPEDISIAGFNDLDFAEELTPSLTTVSIPLYEMGKKAAEYLLHKIVNRTNPDSLQYDVSYKVVERKSTYTDFS